MRKTLCRRILKYYGEERCVNHVMTESLLASIRELKEGRILCNESYLLALLCMAKCNREREREDGSAYREIFKFNDIIHRYLIGSNF